MSEIIQTESNENGSPSFDTEGKFAVAINRKLSEAPFNAPAHLSVKDASGRNRGEQNNEIGIIRLKLLRPFALSDLGRSYEVWDERGELVIRTERLYTSHYLEDLKQRLGCGGDLIYEWVRRIKEAPENIKGSDLLKRAQGGGRGTSRLDEFVDVLLEDAVRKVCVDGGRRPGSKKCFREIRAEMILLAKGRKFVMPCTDAIKVRCFSDDIKRACQDAYQRDHLQCVCGPTEEIKGLNAVVQMDTTAFSERKTKRTEAATLYVLNSAGAIMGPANVTFAILGSNRGVWSYLPFVGAPNAYLTGIAFKRGLLSKEPLLKGFGLDAIWPFHGKPGRVFHDMGTEFENEHFKRVVRDQDIPFKEVAPGGTPHYRGTIERFHHTAHVLFTQFIESKVGLRYTTKIPSKPGALGITLENLDRALAEWIVADYHTRAHGGLGGVSPIARWEKMAEGKNGFPVSGLPMPVPVESTAQLRWDFNCVIHRTLNHTGISCWNRKYAPDPRLDPATGAKLRSLLRPGKRSMQCKIEVGYNPYDLSCVDIRIEVPGTSEFEILSIPYRPEPCKYPEAESFRSCSLWEWESALKALRCAGVEPRPGLAQELLEKRARDAESNRLSGAPSRRTKRERARNSGNAAHFGGKATGANTEASEADKESVDLAARARQPKSKYTPPSWESGGGWDDY